MGDKTPDFLQKIKQPLQDLITGEKPLGEYKFLLAVSGGIDSMVMAHAFLALRLNFGVAHFNFQLRGEDSEKDARLTEDFCKKNKIPFHLKSTDTTQAAEQLKMSVQETARHIRYQFFDEVCKRFQYDFICTAHHAHDQLETFIIHLIRGSGLKGLTGIPQRRENILRPMLEIPLSEIRVYAEKHKIPFRTDITNLSDDYLRNKIRHHITEPLIQWDDSYLPNALRTISQLTVSHIFIEESLAKFRAQFSQKHLPGISSIHLENPEINTPTNQFLLQEFLRTEGLYQDSIEDLSARSGNLRTGSRFEGKKSDGFYDRGTLWLIRKNTLKVEQDFNLELGLGRKVILPVGDQIRTGGDQDQKQYTSGWSFSIDPEKIKLPLRVRHRRPGDKIWLGNPPYYRKSLKKLFVEKRIPLPFKDWIYILIDAENEILSVLGLVNSSRYVSEESQKKIRIHYKSSFLEKILSRDEIWEGR